MAAAAIAAKAAAQRRFEKKRKAEIAAAIAAGIDPEEELLKRAMAKAEVEKPVSKWQNPDHWTGYPQKYVRCANKAQAVAEGDTFNLFIIGVIVAAGVIVGFQTYAVNDPAYLCNNVGQDRFSRCLVADMRDTSKPGTALFDTWCTAHGLYINDTHSNEEIEQMASSWCDTVEARFGRAQVPLTPNWQVIEGIDYFILGIFGFEVIIKVVAEGMAPWKYWTGAEWKWNNFDFLIVVLCLPIWGDTFGGSSVALLRLMRLMRVMKLIKKIPQLQMIVMGLVGGLKSIAYIMLLLFLVFYLFAISGFYAFAENDPFHFGSLALGLITLFRAATLEDWTDIMYINIFGCNGWQYDSGIYRYDDFGRSGVKWEDGCDVTCIRGAPSIVVSPLYWVFFIIISALVMLSLFIGAVTMSMTESMEEMKREAREAARVKQILKAKARAEKHKKLKEQAAGKQEDGSPATPKLKRRMTMRTKKRDVQRVERKLKAILISTWEGVELLDLLSLGDEEAKQRGTCMRYYWELSKRCERIATSAWFTNLITGVILCAGVMVGIQTEVHEENRFYASCRTDGACAVSAVDAAATANASLLNIDITGGYSGTCAKWDKLLVCDPECLEKSTPIVVLESIDAIILAIFTAEVVLKVIGKFDKPWQYFYVPRRGIDGWNTFDFIVVAGSFLPGSGSLLTMLRLLRLLRVLKLLKAFPELQVIVMALISGLGSIMYIGVILVMVFYIFGILAMILYKANDPWHFSSVHLALLSLFRAATLEDWSDIMYVNFYGCSNYAAYGTCADASVNFRTMALRAATGSEEQVQHWNNANITAHCGEAIELGYTPECCCQEHSSYGGVVAVVFFIFFTVLGALVLMTLFIGVITTSMEEAQEEQEEKKAEEDEIKQIMEQACLATEMVKTYRMCFDLLDVDGGGSIDTDELRQGLALIKVNPTDEQLHDMMAAADLNDEGDLTFPAFIKLMAAIKTGKHKTALSDNLAPTPSYHYVPETPKSGDDKPESFESKQAPPASGNSPVGEGDATAEKASPTTENASDSRGPSSKYIVSSPSSSQQQGPEGNV